MLPLTLLLLGCGHDPDSPTCEWYCKSPCAKLMEDGGGDLSTECGTCVGAEYSCRPGMHGMELMRPKQAFGSTAPTQPTQPTSPHPSGVSPECHVWCEDSCGSLNGDVVVECGGCQGDSFACRPGASDFPVAAAARTPLHGSLSPVESWPTLFESDGRFSGCISSACMQKNGALLEQAALAAEEFSFAPSKGGDDGACELPQLSHVDIEKMTPAQRANALAGPVIVTGLLSDWAAASWRHPQRFADSLGHHAILARRSASGWARAAAVRLDVNNMSMGVDELLWHSPSEHTLILENTYMSAAEAALFADVEVCTNAAPRIRPAPCVTPTSHRTPP